MKRTAEVHFGRGKESRKVLRQGTPPAEPKGRVPRVAKLMALAIRFEQIVRDGEVADYAELGRDRWKTSPLQNCGGASWAWNWKHWCTSNNSLIAPRRSWTRWSPKVRRASSSARFPV